MYDLCALVEHVGLSPQAGHYIAYKRLLPETPHSRAWVEANDCQIRLVSEAEVLRRQSGAYLLFY